MELKDKAAIVTGAGSGIGREVAVVFARAGARVVVSDIAEANAQETVKQIMSAGGTAHFVKADTSKPADNEALVGETVKKFGALNIAVNNAGIGGPGAFTGDYPIDGWDKVIAVNLSGVVNMSSILGQVAFRGSPAYVAAKHGLLGLTKTAAVEYAQQNIRINSVGPGFIRTPLLETMNEETLKAIAAMHPMNRLGTVAEVAGMVLWLASGQASFVTGAYFAVDGGYLAQ
jgi:NAD(P)-dependent dehydrogenase (short-subunit alcohol dehydrogenase family)